MWAYCPPTLYALVIRGTKHLYYLDLLRFFYYAKNFLGLLKATS